VGFKLFDPNPYPSVNMQATLGFKLLNANFGDNYSQRAGDGINSTADKIDGAWDNLTTAEYLVIFNFLKGQKGIQPFYFQVTNVVYWQKWTCNADITRTFVNGQNVSMQVTFQEVFDVDPGVASAYTGIPPTVQLNSLGVPVVDVAGNYVLTS